MIGVGPVLCSVVEETFADRGDENAAGPRLAKEGGRKPRHDLFAAAGVVFVEENDAAACVDALHERVFLEEPLEDGGRDLGVAGEPGRLNKKLPPEYLLRDSRSPGRRARPRRR